MKVCLFGSYIKNSHGIPSGNTGELIKIILKSQGVEVVECYEPILKFYQFFTAYVKLIFKHKNLEYDFIILPWRSIITLPLIKLIHRKPIIYFPAFSIYDTLVNDRKNLKKNSLRAKIIHWIDGLACKLVDRVVLESSEEINYFIKEFNLPNEKFRQLSFATDESIFIPQSDFRGDKFAVLFFGTFIPLHGIEIIVDAANLLKKEKDIEFILCGDGQTMPEIKKLIQKKDIDNIVMSGFVSKKELLEHLKKSNVCLGIFGNTIKANKVVTNKVFQILASRKPLITMDSAAVREIFLKNGINCMLVQPSSSKKLAEAILFLKNNPEKTRQIASAGYDTYQEHLSINQVGKKLVGIINELRLEKTKTNKVNQKIKVYSLSTTYPESPESTKAKFVHLLNKELVKLGLDVLSISPHQKGARTNEMMDSVRLRRFRYLPETFEISKQSIPETIEQSKSGFAKIVIMFFSFFFFTLFSCIREKPDIVHGQWVFPSGYIAHNISKIFKTKTVITVHHIEIPLLRKYKFWKAKAVKIMNKSSQIIAVSDFTKNELISLGVNKEKIIVIRPIPNFVNHTTDNEFLKKFKNKITLSDRKIILYFGRLVEHKGVEYLIRALLEIKEKNVHLVIAGDGYLLDELKKLTESLGLQKMVTFFGRASSEELGWLQDMSDIFVCPSIIDSQGYTEGLGLVIPEAMESGIPVIATSVGGIKDIIKNEVNELLVPQKNPSSIADSIKRILHDDKLTQNIIESSKITLDQFNPASIAQQHFHLFQNILKE